MPRPFAFLIFEGGGAKGIAHLGALRAMEDLGYSFAGVAGASAGAFVAALVAAGYRSDELLDIASPSTNLLTACGLTPTDLLGVSSWSEMRRLRGALGRLRVGAIAAGAPGAAILAPTAIPTLLRLLRHRGHFDTAPVRDFIDARIRERLGDLYANIGLDPATVPDPVCFQDFDYGKFSELRPLKIVATNIDAGRAELFDRVRTPNVVIADAVAASIAIPAVFRPVHVRTRDPATRALTPSADRFADGGLVSNLPSWVFMDEKLALERTLPFNAPVPIVAFALTPAPRATTAAPAPREPDGFGEFLAKVGRSAIFGGQRVSRAFLRDLTIVDLPTALGVLEFDAPWPRIRADYMAGRQHATRQVKQRLIDEPAAIHAQLEQVAHGARTRIDAARDAAGKPRLAHLRACRIEPFGAGSLRVSHGYNMDSDADDRLPLDGTSQRGASKAFRTRDLEIVRFGPPSPADVMTKYERALVRPGLRTALCVPIFPDAKAWETETLADRPKPLGVLSLDSDEDLVVEFADPDLVRFVALQSVLLSASFER
jgi:predicted acylesterase/phospholipase RssA